MDELKILIDSERFILNAEKSLIIRKLFLRNNLNNNFYSDLYSSSCYHHILTSKFQLDSKCLVS